MGRIIFVTVSEAQAKKGQRLLENLNDWLVDTQLGEWITEETRHDLARMYSMCGRFQRETMSERNKE